MKRRFIVGFLKSGAAPPPKRAPTPLLASPAATDISELASVTWSMAVNMPVSGAVPARSTAASSMQAA